MITSFRSRVFLVILCVDFAASRPLGHDPKSALRTFLDGMDDYKNKTINDLTKDDMLVVLGELATHYVNSIRNLAQCFAVVVLRSLIERFELMISLSTEERFSPKFLDNLNEELINELRKKATFKGAVANLKAELDNYLRKKSAHQTIDDKETGAYKMTRENVEYHYRLWRWFLASSNHPFVQKLRDVWNTEEKQKQGCAGIATLYIFSSNKIRLPRNSGLSPSEIVEGLKQNGINDEFTLQVAALLLHGDVK